MSGKRKNCYVVDRGHRFLPYEWDKLREAIAAFARGFYNGSPEGYAERYTCGMKAGGEQLQEFVIYPVDHGYFNKDEINAMYWYFRGVMVAHKIRISGDTADDRSL